MMEMISMKATYKKAPAKVPAKKKISRTLPALGSSPDNYGENDFWWDGADSHVAGCCGLGFIADLGVGEEVADGKVSITKFDKTFIAGLISYLPNQTNIATTIIKYKNGKPLDRHHAAVNNVLRAMGFIKAQDFLGNTGNHIRLWIRVASSRKIPKPRTKKK